MKDQNCVFLKLNQNINIQPFLPLFSFKIKSIEYKQDYMNQMGMIELKGERSSKNITYVVAFDDTCKIYENKKA